MTDKTKPLENSAEEPETTALQKRGGPRGWWVLSSAAGVALLVMGLLGGILIGQTMHPPGQQERTAHVFIERGQARQLDQLPQRLKERFQQQPTAEPSEPSTGDNG